ncbi:MAG: hypothetical protein ACTSSK_13405 [Candidatus Heimdallarchaeota archaeon]
MREITEINNYRQLILNLNSYKINLDNLQDFEKKLFKNTIRQLCDLGLFRTHILLTSMIKDFVFHGSIKPSTIKEIEDKCPWKWDQTTKYLTILEKNGFVSFNRNNDRYKTCELKLTEDNKTTIEIQHLLTYYTNYFKKENFTQDTIETIISHLHSLFDNNEKLEKIKKMFERNKLHPISNEEQNQFIEDVIKCYDQEPANEIISITKLLAKNPYFLKGLSKGGK